MYEKINITENHLNILSLFTRGFDSAYYIREVEKILKISHRTAQLILEDLEKKAVLGSKTRGKIRTLRQAGAKEIHMRVSCPPIRHPCFYGVDFPTKEELLANNRDLEQIREFLEVDSVGYMSLEGLLSCATKSEENYCTACWNGKYRIPVDTAVNKFAMERYQMYMFDEEF